MSLPSNLLGKSHIVHETEFLESTDASKIKKALHLSLDSENQLCAEIFQQQSQDSFSTFILGKPTAEKTLTKVYPAVSEETYDKICVKLALLSNQGKTVIELLEDLDEELTSTDHATEKQEPIDVENEQPEPNQESLTEKLARLSKNLEDLDKSFNFDNEKFESKVENPTEEASPEPKTTDPQSDEPQIPSAHTEGEDVARDALRTRATTLLETIRREEQTCASYVLYSPKMLQLNTVAKAALENVKTLFHRIEDPKENVSDIQDGIRAAEEVHDTFLRDYLAETKQAEVFAGMSDKEAAEISIKLKAFSPDICTRWDTMLDGWVKEAAGHSSLEATLQHNRRLKTMIDEIAGLCRNEAIAVVNKARAQFEELIKDSDNENSSRLSAKMESIKKFISQIWQQRINDWNQIETKINSLDSDIDTIAEWQAIANSMLNIDEELCDVITQRQSNRFQNCVTYVKSMFGFGHDADTFYDEMVVRCIEKILSDISEIGAEFSKSDTNADLLEKFINIPTDTELSLASLKNLIAILPTEVDLNTPIQKSAFLRLEQLGAYIDLFLGCLRTEYKKNIDGLNIVKQQILKTSSEPSIEDISAKTLNGLKNLIFQNDVNLHAIRSFVWRNKIDESQILFKDLLALAVIQLKYQALIGKISSKLPVFFGQEKEEMEGLLADLTKKLDLHNAQTIDKRFIKNYASSLEISEQQFDKAVIRQKQKDNLIESIHLQIEDDKILNGKRTKIGIIPAFREKLRILAQIEQEFSIKLEITEILTKKIEDFGKYKVSRVIPSGLFASEHVLVVRDLSYNELLEYRKNLMDDIAREYGFIEHESKIKTAIDTWKALQTKQDLVQKNIRDLEEGSRLQFVHSTDMQEALKKINKNNDMRGFFATSHSTVDMNTFIQVCKNRILKLENLLYRFHNINNLDLLVQMDRLEDSPAKVTIIRNALLKQIREKIEAHQEALIKFKLSVNKYPVLVSDVEQYIDEQNLEFNAIRHCFPDINGTALELLSRSELSSYSKAVESIIANGKAFLDTNNKALLKIANAGKAIEKTVNGYKQKVGDLTRDHQLVPVAQLEKLLKEVETEIQQQNEEQFKQPSLPFRIWNFLFSSLEDNYVYKAGLWIGKLESAVRRAKQRRLQTAYEQLKFIFSSNESFLFTVEDGLRKQYVVETKKSLIESGDKLTRHKNTVADTLSLYIPPHCDFYSTIMEPIQDKQEYMESLQKGLPANTGSSWFSWWCFRAAKSPFLVADIEKLTVDEMEEHQSAIKQFVFDVTKFETDARLPVTKAMTELTNYRTAMESVQTTAKKLEKKDQFFYKFHLLHKVDKIDTAIKKDFQQKVDHPDKLFKMISALKIATATITTLCATAEKVGIHDKQLLHIQLGSILKDRKLSDNLAIVKEQILEAICKKIVDNCYLYLATHTKKIDEYEGVLKELEKHIPHSWLVNLKDLFTAKREQFEHFSRTLDITGRDRLLSDMSPQDLYEVNPEETVKEFFKSELIAFFPEGYIELQPLIEAQADYTKNLDTANEKCRKFLRDGQILHSVLMKVKIRDIEKQYNGVSALRDTDVSTYGFKVLTEKLRGKTGEVGLIQKLKDTLDQFEIASSMPIDQQIDLLDTSQMNPQDLSEIREGLVTTISDQMNVQYKRIDSYLSTFETQSQKLKMPESWLKFVTEHLDQLRAKLWSPTDIEDNLIDLKEAQKYLKTTFVALKKDIQRFTEMPTNPLTEPCFCLQQLKEKTQFYFEAVSKAHTRIGELRHEHQMQAVQDLEKAVKEIVLTDATDINDLKIKIKELVKELNNRTPTINQLINTTKQTTGLMTLIQQLNDSNLNPQAKEEIKIRFLEKMAVKLRGLLNSLDDYQGKVLESLKTNFRKLSTEEILDVPKDWEDMLRDNIRDERQRVERLFNEDSDGNVLNDPNSPDAADPRDLENYRTYVEKITDATSTTGRMREVESRLHVTGLDAKLKLYLEKLNICKQNLADDSQNVGADGALRIEHLTLLEKTQTYLVTQALSGLHKDNAADCMNAVGNATKLLESANNAFEQRIPVDLDPWSKLKKNDSIDINIIKQQILFGYEYKIVKFIGSPEEKPLSQPGITIRGPFDKFYHIGGHSQCNFALVRSWLGNLEIALSIVKDKVDEANVMPGVESKNDDEIKTHERKSGDPTDEIDDSSKKSESAIEKYALTLINNISLPDKILFLEFHSAVLKKVLDNISEMIKTQQDILKIEKFTIRNEELYDKLIKQRQDCQKQCYQILNSIVELTNPKNIETLGISSLNAANGKLSNGISMHEFMVKILKILSFPSLTWV